MDCCDPSPPSRLWSLCLLCILWWASALPAENEADPRVVLDAWLTDANPTCQTLKTWGTAPGGDAWLLFEISCLLPELPAGRHESDLSAIADSDWVAAQDQLERRFAAAATLAALGRFHELPPAARIEFVLELAQREHQPFASAQIGFGFGERHGWDEAEVQEAADLEREKRPEAPRRVALGALAAPWDPEMIPVIRRYLFYDALFNDAEVMDAPTERVSTLAVYTLTLMVPQLDHSIVPDLRRVLRLQPGSFEAEMAEGILEELTGQ